MRQLAQVVVNESAAHSDEAHAWSRGPAQAALREAMRGEVHEAAALIAEVERSAGTSGRALDLVLASVARATLLGIDGQTANARAELARALRVAIVEAVDPALVTRLVRGLGDVVLVTGPARRQLASSSALAWPLDAVIIDARSHELRAHGWVRSLERRPVVRRLLYALARCPSRVLDKEALAEAIWATPYDPRCHDDALKSNVLHLRRVLAGSGVTIACGNPGYRLEATRRFVFVVPFDLLDGIQLDSSSHSHG